MISSRQTVKKSEKRGPTIHVHVFAMHAVVSNIVHIGDYLWLHLHWIRRKLMKFDIMLHITVYFWQFCEEICMILFIESTATYSSW